LIETSKEVGGLSGSPLHVRAVEVVRYIYEQTKGTIPIIGVGGVSSADDVVRMMKAGASLVQIYTAFIYGGPAIVKKIKQDLVQFCVDEGIGSVNDIVGSASK
jgi:dihydroorotate dehydrogenase